jgi:hypothetical protein
VVSRIGKKYIGRPGNEVKRPGESGYAFQKRKKERQEENPRYLDRPTWMDESKYAGKKWDRLYGSLGKYRG